MKTKIPFFLLIAVVLATTLFFALSGSQQPNSIVNNSVQASELYQENDTSPPAMPTPIPGISVLAIQKYAQNGDIMTDEKSGFEVSATNFRLENEEIMVDVCFQVPDSAEWWVWDATLQAGDDKLLISTVAWREWRRTYPDGKRQLVTWDNNDVSGQEIPHDDQPDYVCQTIAFFSPTQDVNPAKVDIRQAKLIIHSIGTLPWEGQECISYLNSVQNRLNAKDVDIKLDCVSQDGGASLTISEKPADMPQDEAELLVAEAWTASFTVQGPWLFSPSK